MAPTIHRQFFLPSYALLPSTALGLNLLTLAYWTSIYIITTADGLLRDETIRTSTTHLAQYLANLLHVILLLADLLPMLHNDTFADRDNLN